MGKIADLIVELDDFMNNKVPNLQSLITKLKSAGDLDVYQANMETAQKFWTDRINNLKDEALKIESDNGARTASLRTDTDTLQRTLDDLTATAKTVIAGLDADVAAKKVEKDMLLKDYAQSLSDATESGNAHVNALKDTIAKKQSALDAINAELARFAGAANG